MVSRTSVKIIKAYQRPARIDDVSYVGTHMRQEDMEECFAHSGSSPVQSLFECFFTSNPK